MDFVRFILSPRGGRTLSPSLYVVVATAARRRAFYLSISFDRARDFALWQAQFPAEVELARHISWLSFGGEATAMYAPNSNVHN